MAVNKTELTKFDIGVAIGRTNPFPLDSTENLNGKSSLEEYAKSGPTSYVGLIVKLIENGAVLGCYIIKNTNGDLIELSTKSQLDEAILKLGPIFKFIGVANNIDPDHSTLTIGSGNIGIPAGTSEKLSPLISYGTILEKNSSNIIYAWGTESLLLFYTREIINSLNYSTILLLGKGQDLELEYITVYGSEYFFKNNETIELNTFTVWESLEGDTLYSLPNNETVDIYVTLLSTTPLLSGVLILKYTYSEFYPLETYYSIELYSDLTPIEANEGNNGHVYLLGEEEYASNGLMWVLLGSPKQDWIIL